MDVRASTNSGSLMLVWLPVNAALALVFGPRQTLLRVYPTKDDAWADWHRITSG